MSANTLFYIGYLPFNRLTVVIDQVYLDDEIETQQQSANTASADKLCNPAGRDNCVYMFQISSLLANIEGEKK